MDLLLWNHFLPLSLLLTPTPLKSKKHGLKTRNLILVIVFTTFFGVLSLLLLLIYWIRKKPGKCPKSSSSRGLKFFPKITYEELWHATGGFSSENLIGSGSFGTVYKGTLSSDRTSVAVKVLNLRRRGASKSFMAECLALRNIRHNNLVKVITACSSCDFHGDEFKALVYPFMPEGSLDKFLHAVEETPQLPSLSILQRINVVVDVAAALNYLHHQCETPVIHCDLKPQNVLLDNDMTAHVGDFGLARLVIKLSTKEYRNQFSSLGIKGTIGYAAPEYGMGARVWILGDIYSFGILLLEVFTGKRPTDNMFTDNLNLHHFVKLAVPERVDEILDSSALCPKSNRECCKVESGLEKVNKGTTRKLDVSSPNRSCMFIRFTKGQDEYAPSVSRTGSDQRCISWRWNEGTSEAICSSVVE